MASPSKKIKYEYGESDLVDEALLHQVAKYVKHDRLGDLAKHLCEFDTSAASPKHINHVSIIKFKCEFSSYEVS